MDEVKLELTNKPDGVSPLEGTQSNVWNKAVHTTKKTSVDKALDALLQGNMVGLGKVSLDCVEIVYMMTATGQEIQAAFTSTSCGEDLDTASFDVGGINIMGTDNNLNGINTSVKIRPNQELSRQIRPISADKPAPKFMWKISEGVKFKIWFHLICTGTLKEELK